MELAQASLAADRRVRPHVRETPLERSPALSSTSHQVYLKLENYQATGSFKLRGVMNKLLALDEEQTARGVVAASSGNHGAALASAAAGLGLETVIFVPEDASPAKIETIRAHGAEVRVEGEDCVITEARARRFAAERGGVYVSPYNDEVVVAGQGTVGVEIARQLDEVDTVIVSLGGGGLISGVASYLKSIQPSVRVVAASAGNSAVMHHSLAAGRILEMPSLPTLSDATAGGVEAGSITFELCARLVDDSVLVDEDEIAGAMRLILRRHAMLIEGAAGVAVAAFLKERERLPAGNVVIVLCGANVSLEKLRDILA